MATQQELDLRINTSVEAGNSAASIRQLRTQIQELNAIALQFGEDFPESARKAQQEAARLADKLDDTRESLSDLKGEPIERINASVSRLREGFMTLDLGKIGQSFRNLGAAINSAGGFLALLVGAVMLIIEHFDTLKNSGGLVGAVFTAIGEVVDFVKNMFLDLADSIGLVDKAMIEQMNKEKDAKTSKDELTQSTKLYNDEQDRELQLMRAKGASNEDILKKQRAILLERLKQDDEARKSIKKTTDEQIRSNAALKTFITADRNELGVPINPLFKKQELDIQRDINKEKREVSVLNDKERSDLEFQLQLINAQLSVRKEVTKTKKTEVSQQEDLKKIVESTALPSFDSSLGNREENIKRMNESLKRSIEEVNAAEFVRQANQEALDNEELFRIKQKEDAYKSLGSTFDKMAQNFNSGGNLIAASIARSFGGIRQSMSKAIGDFKKNKDEFTQSALSAASSLAGGIGDLLSAGIQQQIQDSKRQTDERLNDLNKQFNASQSMLDQQLRDGLISEDQYNNAKTKYQEEFNKKKYELELEQFNKETELKRQAFEQNKAIQIVQAIILSTQAALAAYLSGMQAGGPTGPVIGGIFAGIAAAFGAIQVALIASQQFPGNGAGPTRITSPTSPSGGGGGVVPNPVAIGDIGGRLTTQNRQEEMRVYVLEKDITSAQGRQAQIKDRSRR